MPPLAILAGGLATRLHPVTEKMPKSMVDVGGNPFIHHQLELIRSKGVRDVVVCIGHLGHQISEFVGDGNQYG